MSGWVGVGGWVVVRVCVRIFHCGDAVRQHNGPVRGRHSGPTHRAGLCVCVGVGGCVGCVCVRVRWCAGGCGCVGVLERGRVSALGVFVRARG